MAVYSCRLKTLKPPKTTNILEEDEENSFAGTCIWFEYIFSWRTCPAPQWTWQMDFTPTQKTRQKMREAGKIPFLCSATSAGTWVWSSSFCRTARGKATEPEPEWFLCSDAGQIQSQRSVAVKAYIPSNYIKRGNQTCLAAHTSHELI